MTEPERTPRTAPDLEALRKDETYRMDVLLDVLPPMYRGDELSRYTAAVEARVRAEEQAAIRRVQIEPYEQLQQNRNYWADECRKAWEDRDHAQAMARIDEAAAIDLAAERDAARAEVERAEEERDAAREELRRVRAKLTRVKREVRHQMGASQYRNEIERSRALAEQEPCELCPPDQIRRKSIHRVITKSSVHYWCSDHADEHYRHRLAALSTEAAQ